MSSSPIREAKRQMRTIDERLWRIRLTYGLEGIERDPHISKSVDALLAEYDRLEDFVKVMRRPVSDFSA